MIPTHDGLDARIEQSISMKSVFARFHLQTVDPNANKVRYVTNCLLHSVYKEPKE